MHTPWQIGLEVRSWVYEWSRPDDSNDSKPRFPADKTERRCRCHIFEEFATVPDQKMVRNGQNCSIFRRLMAYCSAAAGKRGFLMFSSSSSSSISGEKASLLPD